MREAHRPAESKDPYFSEKAGRQVRSWAKFRWRAWSLVFQYLEVNTMAINALGSTGTARMTSGMSEASIARVRARKRASRGILDGGGIADLTPTPARLGIKSL
jgi:hypothetical protein